MPTDSQRYHLLKNWLLTAGPAHWIELPKLDSLPFVMGTDFYGESFDAAVDTLPRVHQKFHTVIRNNYKLQQEDKDVTKA